MKRTVGTLAGVAFLLLLAFLTIAYYQLPRISDFRGAIIRRPVLARTNRDVALSDQPLPSGSPAAPARGSPAPARAGPLPPPPEPGDMPRTVVADYLVERFVQSPGSDVRVCENLADLQFAPPRNPEELQRSIASFAARLTPENPFVESAIAPLGAVLRNPEVAGVVEQIWEAASARDDGLLDRARFYTDLGFAAAELYTERPLIQRVSQHAYHLYVISRAVVLDPELAAEDDVTNLCSSIEGHIENGDDAELPPEALIQEKEDLLTLLASYGIRPSQVGYNPNLPATVQFDFSKDRIAVTSPWMIRQFGTGVSLSGR